MMTRLGRLWLKTSRKGDKFMSGYVEIGGRKTDVIVFQNNNRRLEKNDSNFDIFLSEPRETRGAGENSDVRMDPRDRAIADEDGTPF